MPKKKTRRPARAGRRAAASCRPVPSGLPDATAAGQEPWPGPPRRPIADAGWLRFLPPSAGDILDTEQLVTDMFRKVAADEPLWTWSEDLEDTPSTEDLVWDEFPHLSPGEVAEVAAEWDAQEDEVRSGHRRRFTSLCSALAMAEPDGTFTDLYQFCLRVGLAEERAVGGQPWVFPNPEPRNVLDVLPPASDLAAAERAEQEREAAEQAWEDEWMRCEHAEDIISLLSDGTGGKPATTSIQRLTRLLDAPEDEIRRAIAHLARPIPRFGRSHMTCSHDPLTVPAHKVITLAIDWEAHDLDKGIRSSPPQLAGVACIACGTDYQAFPAKPQVVPGPAGAAPQLSPLVACRGTCAAGYGSPAGTGQPVPPIEDRVLRLKQVTTQSP